MRGIGAADQTGLLPPARVPAVVAAGPDPAPAFLAMFLISIAHFATERAGCVRLVTNSTVFFTR